MSLWAIVPVKPLNYGKSRLAEVLNEEERVSLNNWLYQKTLRTLLRAPGITSIIVVSRDSDVLVTARDIGVRTVQENGSPDLNGAVERASIFSRIFGATSVIIVPADLPLLRPEDITTVINRAGSPPYGVIVPDRRNEGTNMLLLSPPDLIPFSFGIKSFETHCNLITTAKADLLVLENENIQLDLDLPSDLKYLEESYGLKIKQEITSTNQ